jgi:integrase
LILVAYRHGLRAIELCDLEWSQVEFEAANRGHLRPPHWVKVKNPNAPAVKREAEEDWGR